MRGPRAMCPEGARHGEPLHHLWLSSARSRHEKPLQRKPLMFRIKVVISAFINYYDVKMRIKF